MRKGTSGMSLAAALALSVGNTAAVPYTFTNIADTSGPFSAFSAFPSLNNSGTVAFAAGLDTGGNGIFTGSGGPTATLYDTRGPFNGLGPFSLNNSGSVAFFGNRDTGEGIFTGNGGPTTTIADTSGPFLGFSDGFVGPPLNDSGTVAFLAELDGCCAEGIFTGNGGPTTTIADNGALFHGFSPEPSINNNGTVAFVASLDVQLEIGVFTGSGGPITTIAASSGPLNFLDLRFTAINDSGTVAFPAFLNTGEHGIFTGSGGPTTTIADSSGPFQFFFGAPSINNSGLVAFLATLDTGGGGLFTGPDPFADEVIGIGDALFDSTTMGAVSIAPDSLNDTGQIAFFYELADGRSGIARADPLAVPEPGTLSLLVAALLGAVWSWRKKSA
jgi:hypothetical protein